MTVRIKTILIFGALLLSMACNASFSTANLSDLKFAKDKNAGSPLTTFQPQDEIFLVTAVNNASGKNKVKFRLLFDKVEGAQAGTLAYKVENEIAVEGSNSVTFNFALPSGFAGGTYKAEVALVGEDGKEIDRKTGIFMVDGSARSAKTSAPETNTTDADEPTEKEADEK